MFFSEADFNQHNIEKHPNIVQQDNQLLAEIDSGIRELEELILGQNVCQAQSSAATKGIGQALEEDSGNRMRLFGCENLTVGTTIGENGMQQPSSISVVLQDSTTGNVSDQYSTEGPVGLSVLRYYLPPEGYRDDQFCELAWGAVPVISQEEKSSKR